MIWEDHLKSLVEISLNYYYYWIYWITIALICINNRESDSIRNAQKLYVDEIAALIGFRND